MIYCDYNASAPLSDSLKGAFFDLPFANPSSQHKLGKQALKVIHDCERFLLSHFEVSETHFPLFHSGSTEGANFFIRGVARRVIEAKKKPHFLYSKTDHSCIIEQVAILKLMNVECVGVSPEASMRFPKRAFKKAIESILENPENELIVNFTWVHNETGVVWPLSDLKEFKEKYGNRLAVHVDATQSIGKIADYQELNPLFDCYSYSGHKFGALKGIGWSFLLNPYKSKTPIEPLIVGGGQQHWMRSGTYNVPGIFSLQKALEEVEKKFNAKTQTENISFLRNQIAKILKNYGELLPKGEEQLNGNTIFLYFYDVQSQILVPAFDMAGMAVGSGSACSSGTFKESRLLQVVGLNDYAKNGLRISVNPFITHEECEEVLIIFEKVVKQVTKEIDF